MLFPVFVLISCFHLICDLPVPSVQVARASDIPCVKLSNREEATALLTVYLSSICSQTDHVIHSWFDLLLQKFNTFFPKIIKDFVICVSKWFFPYPLPCGPRHQHKSIKMWQITLYNRLDPNTKRTQIPHINNPSYILNGLINQFNFKNYIIDIKNQ